MVWVKAVRIMVDWLTALMQMILIVINATLVWE
jgi:hypothetical protein